MAGQWQDPRWQDPHVQPHVQNSPPQGNHQPQWQPQYPPPPQSPYPPQRPRRRIGKGIGIGCLGLIGFVVLVAALASHSSSSTPPAALPTLPAVAVSQQAASTAAQAAAKQTLTYSVTGSPADVTYGPTGSEAAGTVPLSASGPLGSPLYYSITAQLQGSGTVTCEILIDGKVISQSTASGGYTIASCEISKNPLSGQWQDTNGS